MGMSGYIGIGIDPADQVRAVVAITGDANDDGDWAKFHVEFGLIGENYWDVHLVLQSLAARDGSLLALATAIRGNKDVGEGPFGPISYYDANEVQKIYAAFEAITPSALDDAIDEASAELQRINSGPISGSIEADIRQVGGEFRKLSSAGYALIAFAC